MRAVAIPVKSLNRTKHRLAPVLSPVERATLTLAMLEDVLDAALAIPEWQTWVVSPDEVVLDVAVRRGARAIPEEKPSLLGAVRQVDREATERAAEALAVVLADLPFVTRGALLEALHTLGPVVAAPSSDRTGTNVLVRRPPRAVRPRFGADSFVRHLEEARGKGLPAAVVALPELAFDLDTPDDILTVLRAERRGRTRDVCRELDLASRVRVGA